MGVLTQALRRRRDAEHAVVKVLKERFRVGTRLTWKRRGVHAGQVVMAATWCDRLKVRNERTGKEYWICAYDILDV